jgi:hypothetical protein
MADQKTTQLDENTSPAITDVSYIVDDPGGTAKSEKITLDNLLNDGLITVLGTITSGDADAAVSAASTTVAGKTEYATVAETTTGTSEALAVTPKGLKDGVHSAIGKKTVMVPASSMTPASTSGCANIAQIELTAGQPELYTLDFDDGADEYALFYLTFPKGWDEGTITFQVWWTSTAADTDGVAWGLQGVALSDGDAHETAYGTAVVVTDDAQSIANDVYITGESSAVTIAGTPAADDICYFRIFRDVDDGNDDMAEDAKLIGIKIFYTLDAGSDE